MALMVIVAIPEKEAKDMAMFLLGKKLCACVNIIKGVESYFWWEGKIDEAKEALLLIKTKESLFGRIREAIKGKHSYTVPEIIGFKMDESNKEYVEWLNLACASSF